MASFYVSVYFENVISETDLCSFSCFPSAVVSRGLNYTSPFLANKERLEWFGVKTACQNQVFIMWKLKEELVLACLTRRRYGSMQCRKSPDFHHSVLTDAYCFNRMLSALDRTTVTIIVLPHHYTMHV